MARMPLLVTLIQISINQAFIMILNKRGKVIVDTYDDTLLNQPVTEIRRETNKITQEE